MAKIDRLIQGAKQHLEEGEEIIATVMGSYEIKMMGKDSVRTGILLATNKRVVFFAKKLGGFEFEMFPYSKISSIEIGKSLMGHSIGFYMSGNKVKMKWIQKGDVKGFVEHVKSKL